MPLTPSEIVQLAAAIAERRVALARELRHDLERSREETDVVVAAADDADMTRDFAEDRELEAAAARLAAGTYGICVDCGADVGFERLRAQPAAARCARCQTRHEKTYSR